MNKRIDQLHTDKKARKGDPHFLRDLGRRQPEVRNRGISDPTKKTCVLRKLQIKKKPRRFTVSLKEFYLLNGVSFAACITDGLYAKTSRIITKYMS